MKGNTLGTNTAALATVRTAASHMESADDVEHLLLEGVHICLLGTVKLVAVEDTFPTAACGTDVPAGIAADTFAEFLLEESKLLSRAHSLDLLDLCETVCILCILGLADFLVEDLVLFAFTGMASSQHGIFIGNALLSVKSLHGKRLALIGDLSARNLLDSLDSLGFDLLDVELSFTANADDVSFVPVYPVLFAASWLKL